VSQAGAVLLWEVVRVTGLGRGLSQNLARWRSPAGRARPGEGIADLAAAVALGGDCLADIAVLREQPRLAGPGHLRPGGIPAGHFPGGGTRTRRWRPSGRRGPRPGSRPGCWPGTPPPGAKGGLVAVDLDATVVVVHSAKEQAAAPWKRTFGFHPMTAWADHGQDGNGEPLAVMLRPGNAGSGTAADHVEAARLALAQLPAGLRGRVLVRADSGGGSRAFPALAHRAAAGVLRRPAAVGGHAGRRLAGPPSA
jgi:hypothetical protein